MARLTGRFYFKQTSNRNLLGEFSNNASPHEIYTESADFVEDVAHAREGDCKKFIGKYHSTWREGTTAICAELNISPHPKNPKLFHLEWASISIPAKFKGDGMLCDEILVGDYRQS